MAAGDWTVSVYAQLASTPLPLPLANGGTGKALTASNGGIFYSDASTGEILAGTATANQVLLSGANTAPAWSTTTYPPSVAANSLLYATSANVIGALPPTGSTVLVNNANVPSWSSVLPNGVTAATQALNDKTGKVATDLFANPASSVANPGYMQLPSGVIFQWGQNTVHAGTTSVISLSITFPTGSFNAYGTPVTNGATATQYANAFLSSTSTISLTVNTGTTTVQWWAIGY